MNIPSEKQIKAGHDIADYMMTFSIQKAMGSLGKYELKELSEIPEQYQEIVELYLNDKIDSVTGIYLAMGVEK